MNNSVSEYSVDQLHESFTSVFTSPNTSTASELDFEGLPSHDISLTDDMVEQMLRSSSKKSPGLDGLPHWIFHVFSAVLAPAICIIFNWSLKISVVPK